MTSEELAREYIVKEYQKGPLIERLLCKGIEAALTGVSFIIDFIEKVTE